MLGAKLVYPFTCSTLQSYKSLPPLNGGIYHRPDETGGRVNIQAVSNPPARTQGDYKYAFL